MIITLEQLKTKRACADQIAKFETLFGPQVEVTLELCLKHAQDFDWNWASRNLLSAPARNAYKEAATQAWKAYNEVVAPARKAYNEAKAQARKAYDKALAPAWKAYNEAMAPARKAYDEAMAPAFFYALRSDQ